MASVFKNILNESHIQYIYSLPEVAVAEQKINNGSKVVYFTVELTDEIKESLYTHLGLNLFNVTKIPMRWIKGDTVPHVDRGSTNFENTYLMYLNDSVGEFNIGNDSYPITQNTGFVFDEGILHETLNTGYEPRLLLGPMSEMGIQVGGPTLYYFSNETDALNDQAYLVRLGDTYSIVNGNFTVGNLDDGTTGGFTSWRLASNSNGSSSQSVVYNNGDTIIADGNYFLYPAEPIGNNPLGNICFPAGTPITTNQGQISIEKINPDIHTIGNKKIIGITKTTIASNYAFNKYLVCFEKDSLGNDVPSQRTIISKNHKILYKGQMKPAFAFVGLNNKITKIKYNNEVLYNVLMEDYDIMQVNNLTCETLHPENDIAKIYKICQNLTLKEQHKLIEFYNNEYRKRNNIKRK